MGVEGHDTICAIATPIGEGGLGVLRISGEKAVEAASRVVRLRSAKSLASVHSHRLYHADLVSPTAYSSHSEMIAGSKDPLPTRSHVFDEALVVVMRSPRSYTGETVVEVHCHGSPLVLRLLTECVLQAGARLAEPGEFTKRAFLNGRLDLTQAEAVLDTIRAKTESGLRIAQEQLRGALSNEVGRLREDLIRLLAHVEAGIDFTEEDISFIEPDELMRGVQAAATDVGRLAESCREGRILREGVAAAIVGRPNVGKSSLLNALLRTDRAIVTSVPGTTRDVLEEVLNMRGVALRLLDTAGIRRTDDPVEREGIRRSQSAIEQAELLLVMVDGSVPLTDEDREFLTQTTGRRRVLVVNKCDLPVRVNMEELRADDGLNSMSAVVQVSAITGTGLDELRDKVRALVLRPDFEPGDGVIVTRLRHLTALGHARDALMNSAESVAEGLSGEFVALDLRTAIDALGEMTGAVSTDDILDRIFAEFCIGK